MAKRKKNIQGRERYEQRPGGSKRRPCCLHTEAVFQAEKSGKTKAQRNQVPKIRGG